MRYFSLSLAFLCLLLISCQEEALPVTFGEPPGSGNKQAAHPSLAVSKLDLEEAYREAAVGYHDAVMDAAGNFDWMYPDAQGYPHPVPAPTVEEIVARLQSLADLGRAEKADPAGIAALFQFRDNLDIDDMTYVSEVHQAFAAWRVDDQISLEATPIAYHASRIIEEILTSSQATLGRNQGKGLSNVTGEKNDDGLLCTIEHRNWLAIRLGLCGAANDDEIAEVLSNALRDQISSLATERFNSFSRNITVDLLGDANGELSLIEQQGLNILQDAVGNVVEQWVDELWQEANCRENCDNCGPALGIARIRSGCAFEGIRATGSEFEFNEGFMWLLDYNEDGVPDGIPIPTFTPDLPASAINNTGPTFQARVNVICDGAQEFPWPGGATWARIDTERTPPPTGSITAPPRENGIFYRPGITYCFQATVLTNSGYEVVGWETSVEGSTPMTQSGGGSFCTVFNVQSPISGSVNLVFRDPCTGEDRRLTGPDFVVCPVGECQ